MGAGFPQSRIIFCKEYRVRESQLWAPCAHSALAPELLELALLVRLDSHTERWVPPPKQDLRVRYQALDLHH